MRVGLPPSVVGQPATTSFGRIWSHGPAGLRARGVDVVVADPRRARRWRKVDVWLTDGHQGPLDVREPVVAHLHEAAWDDPDTVATVDPAFAGSHRALSAAAVAEAARVLTVSASSKAQIVAAYGVDAARVDVAWNGVDHSVYRPGVPLTAEVARPFVLHVSTLHPRKNLAALRSAMAGLARRGLPHALVLVAGPAPDRADSADLAAAALEPIDGVETPVVNLAGAPDAVVAALMGSAAAFCLPSLMEGFGMAAAEAMACGAPCVVSDRGSLPEVVGDAGIVVEPTAAGVEAGLLQALTDPGDLGVRAAERARRFTWDAMADAWLASLRAAA